MIDLFFCTLFLKTLQIIFYICLAGVDDTAEERIEKANSIREIVHKNTRFGAMPFNADKNKQSLSGAASAQARVIAGQIGPDGKEILPAQSPRVRGYGFVATPSPAPGALYTSQWANTLFTLVICLVRR